MREDIKNAYRIVMNDLKTKGLNMTSYEDLVYVSREALLDNESEKWQIKKYLDYVKEVALKQVVDDKVHADKWRNLYWSTLKMESKFYFESYILYMEHKRPYEKRFYEPRRKTQCVPVQDLQALEDNTTQKMYTLSEPSRVGKSTLIIFFLTWIFLRHPYSHSAMGTHAGMLAGHFFKEFLEIMTTSEYCYYELWQYFNPGIDFIVDKSAEEMTISFATTGDFPTITCRGIDGTWTGAIDISSDGYLAVDDLVRDRTHSLSPKRMNDTFSEYLNKMVDRMNDGAKQLMIGTLWNVLDPIKRLEEMYKNDDRYVFRKIPALNENDESNFDYEVKGFSTQYYQEMRDRLVKSGNEAEWFAKYQQQPYVREGLLFPLDELGYFNGVLPKNHKYRFMINCDVAFGGGDSVSMPIGLNDLDDDIVYIVDWYFSSSGVGVTVPGVVDMIIKHGIKSVTFEANAGGNLYAQKVQEELRKRNYLCACDALRSPYNISKEDKIKSCEAVIRQKFRFLDTTKHNLNEFDDNMMVFERSAQYTRALEEMSSYVTIGKNLHDDAADSISMIAERVYDTYQRKAVVMASPF